MQYNTTQPDFHCYGFKDFANLLEIHGYMCIAEYLDGKSVLADSLNVRVRKGHTKYYVIERKVNN